MLQAERLILIQWKLTQQLVPAVTQAPQREQLAQTCLHFTLTPTTKKVKKKKKVDMLFDK